MKKTEMTFNRETSLCGALNHNPELDVELFKNFLTMRRKVVCAIEDYVKTYTKRSYMKYCTEEMAELHNKVEDIFALIADTNQGCWMYDGSSWCDEVCEKTYDEHNIISKFYDKDEVPENPHTARLDKEEQEVSGWIEKL